MNMYVIYPDGRFDKIDELYHHGVKGMKWGVRRYKNEDGSLTSAGKKRRNKQFDPNDPFSGFSKRQKKMFKRSKKYVERIIGTDMNTYIRDQKDLIKRSMELYGDVNITLRGRDTNTGNAVKRTVTVADYTNETLNKMSDFFRDDD